MRSACVVVLACVAACGKSEPRVEVDPVTAEQATAFTQEFLEATKPCVDTKVAELIDHEAFAARVKSFSKRAAIPLATKIREGTIVPRIVCESRKQTAVYKLLHVHTVDGDQRPVIRHVSKSERTGVQMVGYDELVLGVSRKDHRVRIIDMYSYMTGQMMSETLATGADATVAAVDTSSPYSSGANIVDSIKQAKQLMGSGKHAEALAAVDKLPPQLRRSRMVQVMRVSIAQGLSEDAYKQALEEVAAIFPDDPAIALMLIDGDVLRGDYDAALHHVDTVDKAVGGDPWQDALRAAILMKRKQPGDVDRAADYSENVVRAEPAMSKGYYARLDVQLARNQTAEVLATMSELERRFGAKWDDAKLRSIPEFANLVASPEYAAWLAEH